MPKNIDLNDLAILIDFDGTITTKDTNDKLVEYFCNDDVEEYLMKNNEEDMSYVEFMDGLFSNLKISEEEYLDFILNEIEISRGFVEFYEKAKSLHIPIAVISGGFSNGIIPFLEKHGVYDIEIYSNSLNFKGKDISIDFYHNRDSKCCHIGLCGNCKIKHIKEFKEKYRNIVFIGDGITDEPIANKADIVFAKDRLLDYCKEHGIDCIPWDDFLDINRLIFKPIH